MDALVPLNPQPDADPASSLVNLPIGAVAVLFIVLFLHSPAGQNRLNSGWVSVLQQFDPIGTVLFIASVVCLLIALQWGGSQYPWSDGREIALLTVFGVLAVAWLISQWMGGENATVPVRIIRQRTVACSTAYIFLASGSFVLLIYYLPIWCVWHSHWLCFG